MEQDQLFILTRLKKGHESAFRVVYDRYHQRIYGFSLKFTHSAEDAQEVVQNTFIKLWQHRAQIDPKQPLEPYLYQIAKNENLKFLQKVARNKDLRDQLHQRMNSLVSTTEQEVIFTEYTAIAQQAIALLPPKRKLVYELSHQQGKTTREIATYMGTTPQTVRQQLAQALHFIKIYLKQHADLSLGLLMALLAQF
ncbi:RNA polymerase sigma factor [Tunicatimonas pelagia]|uniref:RNA polymerase sigma factor n=1 Tax=Tunicatimonas pelagia TaxID=931531 RepID=UPI002666A25C|nr:RNA polymerase sigma-70 factor [Tunicatimonas pelagia]WKN43673.1 RNA polymerase sigma-70 factor [Tunicatimonas pelagia]